MLRVERYANNFILFFSEMPVTSDDDALLSPLHRQQGVLAGVFKCVDRGVNVSLPGIGDSHIIRSNPKYYRVAIMGINTDQWYAIRGNEFAILH